jgi:hypothetical protein
LSTPTQAPPKQAAPQQQQAAAMPAAYPFPVGVYESGIADYDQTKAQTTAAQQMPIHNISPTGWLAGLWYAIDMSVTGNVTNSVSYSKDNPWSVINKFVFYDLGGREVIGPIGGYDWMCISKFGAYQAAGDPRNDLSYTATTGTGGTAGTFSLMFFVPLEAVHRDALGTVQNESKPGWKVEIWIDSQANTYNQVPSTLGNVRVRGYVDSYTEPEASAPSGRPFAQTPPLPGTLQYWRSENASLPAGATNYDLVNGIGFPIRNLFYKSIRTATGLRSDGDSDWPDPATLTYGNVTLFQRSKNLWIDKMGRDFQFISTSTDVALGREAGVFPVWMTRDFGIDPGNELRYKYLQTMVNTVLRLSGSWANANTLFALTNWIKPSNSDYFSLLPGR